uniref:Uncharacterized protein n=1 Tax=Panstrongylus lignarius TaxID=156445 RepID=A0A224XY41_9HEMI
MSATIFLPFLSQYTSIGLVPVSLASNLASCPAFTMMLCTVVRKLGGTTPPLPVLRFSSTTRLAEHLARPPRFSATTENTPESSKNTCLKTRIDFVEKV